ncbi:MAG: hypothetical protein OXG74_06875 [Acidobacteria bacterium]|nr:hypothetical protein [Acidobacteriota bacterium]
MDDPLGGPDEDQLAFLGAKAHEVADELPDPGRVHVVHIREVEQNVTVALGKTALQRVGQKTRALAEFDHALDRQKAGIANLSLVDDHQSGRRRGCFDPPNRGRVPEGLLSD